jgi:DNA-binding SARP family transcriptional activator/tetratricopeptide (TPR) repeat protein
MLRLFGEAHIESEGRRLTGLPAKAFVLLALLILEFRGVASREQLRFLLWEDATNGKAAVNLRWLLSRIGKWQEKHGVALIEVTATHVMLAAHAPRSDLAVLVETAVVETATQLDALLDAYRGELLVGLEREFGTQLLELIALHRAALHRKFVALARAAAERIGGARGEDLVRRLLALAPDDEALFRALIRLLDRQGNRNLIAAEYESFVERLDRDYGADPSLETEALVAQLVPARSGASTASVADAAASPAVDPTGSRGGIPRLVLLPPSLPFPVSPRSAGLAAAMIEDVSLHLCRMRTFAMFAPFTARQIQGLDPVTAVAPFDVGYVASTSLLPGVDGLRLSIALMRTDTRQVLFGEQFEFNETELAEQFTDMARAIARQVAAAVEEVEVAAYRSTGAASAYVQYLLGSRHMQFRDLKSMRRARQHFSRALDLSPDYVPAVTGLARSLTKESLALRRGGDRELVQRAMALAEKAIEMDPLDPNAWRERAHASLYLNDLDAGLEYIEAARGRARHHADILAEKADILIHASRAADAKASVEQALALNPAAPDDYLWILGASEFFIGRYGVALETLLKIRQKDDVSRLIAAAAAMAGDLETAAVYRRRFLDMYPDARLETFTQFMPYKNKADVELYVEALKRAGFP